MDILTYLPVFSAIVSVAVSYGMYASRVRELSRRVERLDRQNDLLPQLSERSARMEAKLEMVVSILEVKQ